MNHEEGVKKALSDKQEEIIGGRHDVVLGRCKIPGGRTGGSESTCMRRHAADL